MITNTRHLFFVFDYYMSREQEREEKRKERRREVRRGEEHSQGKEARG